MRKERNKERRVEMNINNIPPKKKRKLTTEKFMTVKQMLQGWKKEQKEEGEEKMIDDSDSDNTKVRRIKLNEELNHTNVEKNKTADNKIDEGEEEDIDWNLEIKKYAVKQEERRE